MTSAGKRSEVIRRLRRKLTEILKTDTDAILDELDCLLLITQEEYFSLSKISNPEKRVREILNTILQRGEETCRAFLDILKNLRSSFPDLVPLLESPRDGSVLVENVEMTVLGNKDEEPSVSMLMENVEIIAVEKKEENNNEPIIVETVEMTVDQTEAENCNARRKAFDEVLSLIKMDVYRTSKLKLGDVLEIGDECLKATDIRRIEDVPWHVLSNIMALNVTARNTSFGNRTVCEKSPYVRINRRSISSGIPYRTKSITRRPINPLDVLCALYYCSDSFLQQEIMLKMSMCQFALPLLLPPFDGSKCMLMLWAMRDIVKKWRPHSLRESKGFIEESLVLIRMPTISFVRLKHCSISKSKILNEVLSPAQQHHDYFVHKDMESGNCQRKISSGLVEVSWYFPGGRQNSDLFPEPVAVTNLRGDIESHWLQFSFLSEVSSAVFIFVEHISDREYALIMSLKESKAKYYFILNSQVEKFNVTLGALRKLASSLKLGKSCLLVKDKGMNDAEFVKKLQSTMLETVLDAHNMMSVENMAATARELTVQVDEDCEECQRARVCAREITIEINSVVEYKEQMMELQGDLWKKLSNAEKEFCRMRRQGHTPPEVYKSDLRQEIIRLRKQQSKCDLSNGMLKFIAGIRQTSKAEKHFFLKWMKFNLDHTARTNSAKLRTEYKVVCNTLEDDPTQLAELDRKILESSLGLEHFMRELGQFYEAECLSIQSGKSRRKVRPVPHLPSIAADLLLDGFPLELIDGDASNIPLQWITDVLTELDTKLGGQSRMIVLTVLGVQSTGKSTLLNTMFGLQFSVSSGRCTRGAFMLLIKVKDNLKKVLGCDFILVIDTEGLKAPELSMLEDSYEHDNELATLVIGLSDITIVNIAMENATEMKDILQIVVHAFLRMEEIGQTPNCQFVHQNVSDVSAYDQNMRDRKHLLEQLNEMTKIAAKMEKQRRDITFSDIMEYDPEKHNWYIPGLWHGVPPMAPVNRGYSENVYELKRYLFQYIGANSKNREFKDIVQFMEWLKSLWNAVKHENFIFSFRNSLVAEAYNQLCMKYTEWEWAFRKEMQLLLTMAETVIYNQTSGELDSNIYNTLKQEAFQKLQSGEEKVLTSLQNYFDSGVQNLHLIEKYREDFVRSAKSLKNELQSNVFHKFEEAIHIQKGKNTIETLQAEYQKVIEGKVVFLLEECRKQNCELTDAVLESEFENMWRQTVMDLQLNKLQYREISQDMHCHLIKDLSSLGSFANLQLQNVECLLNYGEMDFNVKREYFDFSWYHLKSVKEIFTHECTHKAKDFSNALINRCMSYIEERASSKVDYDGTYCRELLHIINESLNDDDFQSVHPKPLFQVDLKLHILGKAAVVFQKMHEDFVIENDPQSCLEKFKPHYLSIFKDLYMSKDAGQKRAKGFCYQCLKPALTDHIERRLGLELVDDILLHGQSIKFSSRTFFQYSLLENILLLNSFEGYKRYICNYEAFVKQHIFDHILRHCSQTGVLKRLETNILSTITKQVIDVLQAVRAMGCKTVLEFIEIFCRTLQNELVISQGSLDVILFQNTANTEQFADDSLFFLRELEQTILTEYEACEIGAKLSRLPYKPQDGLFKKVFGCAKQCPFCRAPCEAGGKEHKVHFASIHRPQGFGGVHFESTKELVYSLCSSDVVSNQRFRHLITGYQWHPYKDYRVYYPDWCIQPDASFEASDYWKYIFKQFNKQFAKLYHVLPANLPSAWKEVTKKQAKASIQKAFNIGGKVEIKFSGKGDAVNPGT